MKNEGNGHLAVKQTRKMPGDYLLKIKTNQTESSKKLFTEDEKTESIKLQHLLAKMNSKKAQIELTIGDVRLCELFSR
jgi:hypothetical protein